MNELKEMSKRAQRIMVQQAREDKARARYGVFVWRGDGMYKESEALRFYKSDRAADKYANRLNESNPVYVVRRVN